MLAGLSEAVMCGGCARVWMWAGVGTVSVSIPNPHPV